MATVSASLAEWGTGGTIAYTYDSVTHRLLTLTYANGTPSSARVHLWLAGVERQSGLMAANTPTTNIDLTPFSLSVVPNPDHAGRWALPNAATVSVNWPSS